MAISPFNARTTLLSATSADNLTWTLELQVQDLEGVYTGNDAQEGDGVFIDTSPADQGTVSLYIIDTIISQGLNSLTCEATLVDDDDSPGGPPDLNWSIGTNGLVCRLSEKNMLASLVDPVVQKLPSRFNVYIRNIEAFKRLDSLDPTYTNTDPSVIAVGGINVGTTFDETTFQDFMDLLLYPELFGTLTPPSRTFTGPTGLREVGQTLTLTFESTFNRGSISPQYESDSPFRSGPPNAYLYTGPGLPASEPSTDTSDTQVVTSYVVELGGQSWTGAVAYDGGVQPKGSKGTPFDSALAPGQTNPITRTITGVYPFFATTLSIETLEQQALAVHGSTVQTDMAGEDGTNKQIAEFPWLWGEITAIDQWNPFTSSWDPIPVASFTLSTVMRTINGVVVDYRRYTHNGSTIGARLLRWRTS